MELIHLQVSLVWMVRRFIQICLFDGVKIPFASYQKMNIITLFEKNEI